MGVVAGRRDHAGNITVITEYQVEGGKGLLPGRGQHYDFASLSTTYERTSSPEAPQVRWMRRVRIY